MKKQINPTIKAHLIRSAFYLLLLIAVCAIPFALAQRNKPSSAPAQPTKAPPTKAQIAAVSGKILQSDAPAALAGRVASGKPGGRQNALPHGVRTAPLLARISPLPLRRSGSLGAPALVGPRPPRAPHVILYDQYDNAALNSTSSQNFEAAFDLFDDFLGDDFVVPGGETWNISEVDCLGVYFNGVGPANSFNVYFYTNSGSNLPDTLVYTATDQPYTALDGLNFVITLSAPACRTEGTYWVVVQCNMDFGVGGQWGWTDRTVQANAGAAWENPPGGFGVCLTWGRRNTDCGIDAGVPD